MPSPVSASVPVVKPSSHLVWAILSTFLGFLPLGVVAIVFAARVDPLWAAGHWAEARDSSRKARMWALGSVAAGVLIIVLSLVIPLLLVLLPLRTQSRW
jgi:hypothetical protein